MRYIVNKNSRVWVVNLCMWLCCCVSMLYLYCERIMDSEKRYCVSLPIKNLNLARLFITTFNPTYQKHTVFNVNLLQYSCMLVFVMRFKRIKARESSAIDAFP